MSTLKVNKIESKGSGADAQHLEFAANGSTYMQLTSAGSLSAQSLSATQFWGDGSKLSNLPGGGKVLQVVSTTDSTTSSGSTGSGWASGTSLSITPSSASSKVLIRMTTSLSTSDWDSSPGINIQRTAPGSSVALGVAAAAGNRQRTGASVGLGRDSGVEQLAVEFLDSPSTTSACTYEMYVTGRSGYTTYLNRSTDDSDNQYRNRTVTTITLMEISG